MILLMMLSLSKIHLERFVDGIYIDYRRASG